jgi:predicted enzyme related to lactoylglutathione lyase
LAAEVGGVSIRSSQESALPAPNLFLIYVQDAEKATAFYSDLFDIQPSFTSPRYVAFEVAPGILFAVWTGRNEHAVPATPRVSEVGLMVPGSSLAVDDVYARWTAKGVTAVEEPHDDVFGRTFVVADPDGNLIRVSPVD